MDGQELLDRLQFQYDFLLNNQIDLVSAVKLQPLVGKRYINLPLEGQPSKVQFVAEALFVSRLQESRAEMSMHFYRRAYDWGRSRIFLSDFSVSL